MESQQLKYSILFSLVFSALLASAATEVGDGEFRNVRAYDTESTSSQKCDWTVDGSGDGNMSCDGTTFTFADTVALSSQFTCTDCVDLITETAGTFVAGVTSGGFLTRTGTEGATLGLQTTCSTGQEPEWGGAAWTCGDDDDLPEAVDYSNLTGGTGITNSPTGTINATLGTSIDSAEIVNGTIQYTDVDSTQTIGANPANGANLVWFATTGFIFEGSSADTIESLLTAANPTASDKTWTLPDETGTICTSASLCSSSVYEGETHASEHSVGGGDTISVINLAATCTDVQVLGGNAGATQPECQTDDDIPDAGADYVNLALAGDVSSVGLTTTIGADKVLESMLKIVDAGTDEEFLTRETSTGDFEWQPASSGRAFTIVGPDAADSWEFGGFTSAFTVGSIECHTDGSDSGESVDIVIYECDRWHDTCGTTDTITCDSDGTTDASPTDASFDAHDGIKIEINTVTGTVNQLVVRILP